MHRYRRLLRPRPKRPRRRAAEQRDHLAPFPTVEMHPIPRRSECIAGYPIAAGRSAVSQQLCNLSVVGMTPRGPVWVKTGPRRIVRLASGLPQASGHWWAWPCQQAMLQSGGLIRSPRRRGRVASAVRPVSEVRAPSRTAEKFFRVRGRTFQGFRPGEFSTEQSQATEGCVSEDFTSAVIWVAYFTQGASLLRRCEIDPVWCRFHDPYLIEQP